MLLVSESDITELIKSRYGMPVHDIDRLHGYEDVNIHFRSSVNISDRRCVGHGDFILKLARLAPDTACQIELQHKLMRYLYDNGISTSKPVNNLKDETVCATNMKLENQKEDVPVIVHVLTFVPGQTMHDAGNPLCVLESAGKLAGKVDSLLKKFDEDWSSHSFDTPWELSQAPYIAELLQEYCEEDVQTLGQEVINAYKEQIEPMLDGFQKGLIHADLNDCNILVKSSGDTAGVVTYDVCGLIDYGDVCYSYYLYEIATLMADLMSSTLSQETTPLNVARLVLRGYRQEFELQQNEVDCLRIIICVRLLQYYVLSAVSLRDEPSNKYAGLGRDEYMIVAKYLWTMDETKFRQSVFE